MARRNQEASNPYAPQNKGKNILVSADDSPTIGQQAPLPWEGIGMTVQEKSTVAGIMKAAGLNWRTEKHQLKDEHGDVPAFALRRSDTHDFLDTVGNAYVPVQNEDAFAFFKEFVEAGDAKMSVAGLIGGGRYVWGLADLGKSFTLAGGDEVKGYLLVACPHVQGKKFVIKYTNLRPRCNNMITALLRRPGAKTVKGGMILPEFRHAHRTEFSGSAVDRAKEVLGLAREQHEAFGEVAAALLKKRMSDQDALDVLAPVFAPKVEDKITMENLTPRLAQIMSAYVEAPGAAPGNAWGVLNAVTYYATHVAGRTVDRRLGQAWMGKTGNQVLEVQARLMAA